MSVKSEESLDDKTQIKREIKEEKHDALTAKSERDDEIKPKQSDEEEVKKEIKKEELTEEEEKPIEDPLIDAFYSEVIYKTVFFVKLNKN